MNATITTSPTTTATATPAVPTSRVSRSWAVRLGLALLTALGVIVAAVAPSQAWTIGTRTSVPVLPTVYQVQGMHTNIGTPYTPQYMPRVYQAGPVVQRTVTSGSQSVKITYTVSKWNGSAWAKVYSAAGSRTIAPTAVSATLPYLDYRSLSGAGYYTVSWTIQWTSAIGAIQSSLTGAMNQSTDYTCNTTQVCSVAAGYVYLG